SGIASCEAISTLRVDVRRHFKAATSVPPLDHVRVRPGAGYALRADFFISLCLVHSLLKLPFLFFPSDVSASPVSDAFPEELVVSRWKNIKVVLYYFQYVIF
ncbi:MAG: hypothetical protein IJW17_02350, partial [Lentisphaeria bacterium]|nr:hypothetical protein [Lentisphaeria bacterium]